MINHLSHYGSFIYTVPIEFTKKELKELHKSVLFHYEAEQRYIGKRYMGKYYSSKNADLHIKKSKLLKTILDKIESLQKQKKWESLKT